MLAASIYGFGLLTVSFFPPSTKAMVIRQESQVDRLCIHDKQGCPIMFGFPMFPSLYSCPRLTPVPFVNSIDNRCREEKALSSVPKASDVSRTILHGLIRVELETGQIEVLITSLTDEKKIPQEIFKDLYHLR